MSEPYDHLLEAYARLVVRVGVNVQLGQRVVVRGMVEHAQVARAVAAEAYRVGASHVSIEYVDQHLQRAHVDLAPDESLGTSLRHEVDAINAWKDDDVAVIALTGNPNPTLMDGADPARLAASLPVERAKAAMQVLGADHVAWTVVAAPNAGWAESIFGTPDVERLWQSVALATRLDEDDPVVSWQQRLRQARPRRDLLNERGFDRMHFRGPGTDLVVGLAPRSHWVTAGAHQRRRHRVRRQPADRGGLHVAGLAPRRRDPQHDRAVLPAADERARGRPRPRARRRHRA